MAKYAYVTKRLAPAGYAAVTKHYAAMLYEQGHAITLCGNTVNAYHVFHGWHLGYTITKEETEHQQYCPICCVLRESEHLNQARSMNHA